MKREKNTQRTFLDDVFLGLSIGAILYSFLMTFIVFYMCNEVEHLSKANTDKLMILTEKEKVIDEQEKMIVDLEKQLSELPK